MNHRNSKIQSDNYLNRYLAAEMGEKRAKKVNKQAISKYRRTLEKREVQAIRKEETE